MKQVVAQPLEAAGPKTVEVNCLNAGSSARLRKDVESLAMINRPDCFSGSVPKNPEKRARFLDRRRAQLKEYYEYTDTQLASLLELHRVPNNGPSNARNTMCKRMMEIGKGKMVTFSSPKPEHPLFT